MTGLIEIAEALLEQARADNRPALGPIQAVCRNNLRLRTRSTSRPGNSNQLRIKSLVIYKVSKRLGSLSPTLRNGTEITSRR